MTLHPKLGVVYHQVVISNHLEKIAQAYKDDPEVSTAAMQAKIAVDAETFGVIKEASWLTGMAPMLREAGKKALIGTGVALPVAGVGAYLLHRGRKETEEATADIRNKILQTALGIGGIGAGLYGLHKLLAPSKPETVPEPKVAEDEAHVLDDAMTKLATVAAIECMLDGIPDTMPEETQKLAAEVRALNRGYGMQILYALAHG